MPRSRNVKSLKEICTLFVRSSLTNRFNELIDDSRPTAKNVENAINLLAKGEDDELNKSFVPLLDLLPLTLLKKLVAQLQLDIKGSLRLTSDSASHWTCKGNRILWCYLRMLILRESTSIYMNETKEVVGGFLAIASKRFPKLKSLRINEVTDDINLHVTSNIHRFQNLQKLSLWYSNIGDSCLIHIGNFLKDLRYLDVRGCRKVTDAGIAGLCVSVDNSGQESELLGKCKSIRSLKVWESSVSREGIKLALKNLPELQELDALTVQHLAEMHQAEFMRQKLLDMPKYSLAVLNIPPRPCGSYRYFAGSLELVVFLCPSLTSVNVGQIGLKEEHELLSLSALERLSELKIVCIKEAEIITFHGGIVPFLNVKGNSLTSLELLNLCPTPMFSTNIPILSEFCPNLSSLKLWRNSYTSSRWMEERMGTIQRKRIKLKDSKFMKLKELSLCGEILSTDWICLLSSPLLTDIKIRSCDALTDQVLQEAVQSNKFNHLNKLELLNCNFVTGKGIELFMIESNPLTEINLKCCKKLTNKDAENWQNKAVEKNWELSVLFLPYESDASDGEEEGEEEESEEEEGEGENEV